MLRCYIVVGFSMKTRPSTVAATPLTALVADPASEIVALNWSVAVDLLRADGHHKAALKPAVYGRTRKTNAGASTCLPIVTNNCDSYDFVRPSIVIPMTSLACRGCELSL